MNIRTEIYAGHADWSTKEVPFDVVSLALLADENAGRTDENEQSPEFLSTWRAAVKSLITDGFGTAQAVSWFAQRGITA